MAESPARECTASLPLRVELTPTRGHEAKG